MDNQQSQIVSILKKLRERLTNFTRKNIELYFKERALSFNLSLNPYKKQKSDNSDNPFYNLFDAVKVDSTALEQLFTDGEIDLNEYFLINKNSNDPEIEKSKTVLLKKFDKIRLADSNFQKEFGISGAWFLGPFLIWRDKREYNLSDIVVSPILRIPIDIKKSKSGRFTLILEDRDFQINPSLRLYLKRAWDIDLPKTFDCENVRSVLDFIINEFESKHKIKISFESGDEIPIILPRKRPKKNEDGEIIEYEIVDPEKELSDSDKEIYKSTTHDHFLIVDAFFISQVNASRVVLVEDYDKIIEDYTSNPIITELIAGVPVKYDTGSLPKTNELDIRYSERDHALVLSTDSTQHQAIEYANKLQAISIQGPPGTGKSQTITNLIAENLKNGKKVLFVSEKKAALDVVYNRLNETGLSVQTVLIHSSDLNKNKLYESFFDTLFYKKDIESENNWEKTSSELDARKKDINDYYKELSKVEKSSQLSFSDILALYATVQDKNLNSSLINAFKHLSYDQVISLEKELIDIQEEIIKFDNFFDHPWIDKKRDIVLTNSFRSKFNAGTENLKNILKLVKDIGVQCEKITHISADKLLSKIDVEIADKLTFQIKAVCESQALPSFINIFKNLMKFKGGIEKLNISQDELSVACKAVSKFRNEPSRQILKEMQTYWEIPRGFSDFFRGEHWKQKRLFKKYFQGAYSDIIIACKSYFILEESISSLEALIQDFEINLKINIFEVEKLLATYNFIREDLLQLARSLLLLDSQICILGVNDKPVLSSLQELLSLVSKIRDDFKICEDLISEINNYFNSRVFSCKFLNAQLQINLERAAQTIDDLDVIDSILYRIDQVEKKFQIDNFKSILFSNFEILKQKKLGEYLLSQLIIYWHDELKSQSPLLSRFNPVLFNKMLEDFNLLIEKKYALTRAHVNNHLKTLCDDLDDNHYSIKLIDKEANKKRKIKTPREMLETEAKEVMLRLKPCWLMSPISISQILPLQVGIFDVIIFDEASQVRVEDAIPSIYRAKTMVVVGDTQQMPPTNFFNSSNLEDNDEDEDLEEIPESILDQALQVYPQVMLKWHFRSRSEALIAFSNMAFYGGGLIAVPNASIMTDGDSIQYTQLQGATFSYRDGNKKEAEIVVECAYKILRENPEKSLGILAFGQSQVKAIEDVIEGRSERDANFKYIIEQAYTRKDGEADIGFFFKNLENVQGDERDVILLSVGYAPHKIGEKVNKNFGPITMKGGYRRLNVAVTRAKQNIHVFCSFHPDEINTSEEAMIQNSNNVYFGRYLKYVKAISEKNLDGALGILHSFAIKGAITSRKPTRFNLDVKHRLEELGYRVSTEIGTCGYFIDLGIHHPSEDRKFILGIECDGAVFHSTPYAKERDSLRQKLLESRGWDIERIWSTDWSKNWKNEIDRIDRKLKILLTKGKGLHANLSSDHI